MARRKLSGIAEAILETADGLHRVGGMDDETHAQIIMRHGGNQPAQELNGGKASAVIRRKEIEIVL